MTRKLLIFSVLILGLSIWNLVGFADNPIIKSVFTADPAAMVYKDQVYLYTGHDEAGQGGNGFVMRDWLCYSSSDLINWTSHGSPLTVAAFSWARGDAWAGQVIERDGKFYWYICAEHNEIPGKAVGVAVADSPTGPFKDARGTALITNDMTTQTNIGWDDIDPAVFVDDDGQAYLYWGNTVCKYAKLKKNMIELDGPIHTVPLKLFTEAPWLHKRNGVYYLSYACGWPEQIAYATSNSPTGPWTYQGIINSRIPNCGTNHQAIIDFQGQSYFIYHTAALPTGGEFRRSVSIEPLIYNSDGTIQKVVQTATGVGGVKNKIQSLNLPTHFIRRNGGGVILDSQTDPRLDCQWQIVTGLADASGESISLQLVNRPGYYLIQSGNQLAIGRNDGTGAFKKKATFKKVAGLTDAGGVSFQSFLNPELYIRHTQNNLQLDPVGSDAQKADATFRIVE